MTGTWRLESFTYENEGKFFKPFGDSPVGILTYGASCFMNVNFMKPNRMKFASSDQSIATGEEMKNSVNYIGYAGRFEALDKQVIHHVGHIIF